MANQDRVVVVNGVRTPFVRARTVFQKLPASTLGGVALREVIARSDLDPTLVDEVYYGIVSAPSEGTNIAREALFDSGLPSTIPATTINRYCASAAEAAAGIAAKISSGQIEIGIAGGVESISGVRALFSQEATDFFQDFAKAKSTTQKLSHLSGFSPKLLAPHAPGIKEATTGLTMGQSADLMVREFKVTREEQDRFAVDSHLKAHNAWERGFYRSHVVPVSTPDGKIIDKDTDIRPDTTVEKLASLKTAFYKDAAATITAGNASPLTDGAAAVLMMKESKARELKMPVLGSIRGYGVAAVDITQEPLLIGPAYAMPKALKSAGVSWKDIDLFEFHEAFAGQVLSTIRAIESKEWCKEKLGLDQALGQVDMSRLNVNGGSIPLGHPFGATGARMIMQCLHELRARKKNLGLISICAASGLGVVMIVEAI
jgi:acetyl-CoA acyltransferase